MEDETSKQTIEEVMTVDTRTNGYWTMISIYRTHSRRSKYAE